MAKITPVTTDRIPVSKRDVEKDDVLLLTQETTPGQWRNTDTTMQYIGDNIGSLITTEDLDALTYFNRANEPAYIKGNGRLTPLEIDSDLVGRSLVKKSVYPISQVGNLSDTQLPISNPTIAFGSPKPAGVQNRAVITSAKKAKFGEALSMDCLAPVTDGFRVYYCLGNYTDGVYHQTNIEYRPTLPEGYSYEDMFVTNIFCHNDDLMLIRVAERHPNRTVLAENRRDFIAIVETFGSLQARYHRMTKIDSVKFSSAGANAPINAFHNANVWLKKQDQHTEATTILYTYESRFGVGIYRTAAGVRVMRRRRLPSVNDANNPSYMFSVYALKKDETNGVYLEADGITKVAGKAIAGTNPTAAEYIDYPSHDIPLVLKTISTNADPNSEGALIRLNASAEDAAKLTLRDGDLSTTLDGLTFQIITIANVPRIILHHQTWMIINGVGAVASASIAFDILNTKTGVGTIDLGIFTPPNAPVTQIAKKQRRQNQYVQADFASNRFTLTIPQRMTDKQRPRLGRQFIGVDGAYVLTYGENSEGGVKVNLVNASQSQMIMDYTVGNWSDTVTFNTQATYPNIVEAGHKLVPLTVANMFTSQPMMVWNKNNHAGVVSLQNGLRATETYLDGNTEFRGYPLGILRGKRQVDLSTTLASLDPNDRLVTFYAATGTLFPDLTATNIAVVTTHGRPFNYVGLVANLAAEVNLSVKKLATNAALDLLITDQNTIVDTTKIKWRFEHATGNTTLNIRHVVINGKYYVLVNGHFATADQVAAGMRNEAIVLWSTETGNSSKPDKIVAEYIFETRSPRTHNMFTFMMEGANTLTIASHLQVMTFDLSGSVITPVESRSAVHGGNNGYIFDRELGFCFSPPFSFDDVPSVVGKITVGPNNTTLMGERLLYVHPSEPITLNIFTTDAIPFYFNGYAGEFVLEGMDLTPFKAPAGQIARVFLSMFVKDNVTPPEFKLESEAEVAGRVDSIGRCLLAIINVDDKRIVYIDAPPFIRLGCHRLMPRRYPHSIAVTEGAVAAETYTTWGYIPL